MKIRGRKFTANQLKILSKKSLKDNIKNYLFKNIVILSSSNENNHLSPFEEKIEYWDIINIKTGEIERIKIREVV